MAITTRQVAINQDIKAIKFTDSIHPMFGLWCLKAQHNSILSKIDTAAHGTKRLDTDTLRSLAIFDVSIDEQQRFANAISNTISELSNMDDQAAEFDLLFATLQQHAFRGEL